MRSPPDLDRISEGFVLYFLTFFNLSFALASVRLFSIKKGRKRSPFYKSGVL